VKSDDGKRFIKSPELRAEFEQTAAYDELFIELATDDKKLTDFFIGAFPKEFAGEIQKASTGIVLQQTPGGPIVPTLAPPQATQ